MRFAVLSSCLAVFAGCGGVDRSQVAVFASADDAPTIGEFVSTIPFKLTVTTTKTPADDARRAAKAGVPIGLARDLDCAECFRIESKDERYVVHAGSRLGLEYGLSEVLEAYGFRFFHPQRTHVPTELKLLGAAPSGDFAPEQSRRGIHYHTLHPIEPYFALWEPGDSNLAEAKQILDWTVRNRGNLIEWPALDNIQTDPAALAAWTDHTRKILDAAHARGLKMGIGTQLFGSSNLQHAFDLIDTIDDPPNVRDVIKSRLSAELSLPFDVVALSFGEFSGVDAQRFIDRVNDAYSTAQELSPGIEVTANIHVGADVSAQYQGQTVPYYQLVKFADPHIVPWIHSVMYFDLFEPAGGAYGYSDFGVQRQYLLDRLGAGQPAAYFPEDAYWVAFDNCVPTYLPLYVRSRWVDFSKLREVSPNAPLDQHIIFSSGWEWGYWQQDVATLRNGWKLKDSPLASFQEMFAPYGEAGSNLSAAINALAEVQDDALIQHGLAAYYASRDAFMDVGRAKGIVSQPDRPTLDEVKAKTPADRAAFQRDVVDRLTQFAADSDTQRAAIEASGMPSDDPFFKEVVDGARVNVERARFAAALWEIPLLMADGKDPSAALQAMDDAMARAGDIVKARKEAMLWSEARRLVSPATNQTIYHYGYLTYANNLCFWQRERVFARQLALSVTETAPACVDAAL